MAQNNTVNVIGLDFEDIKQSLKTYLESQSNLKDYNFDGSVLNTLLDVLAYNTHYQAFYSNMVANEMFLDSALLRPSVVSHAKHLGYLPSSVTASKGMVNVVLGITASADTYLARGTEFSGTNLEGTRYKFVNLDTVFADAGDNAIRNVQLYEGTIRRVTYIYNRDTKIGSFLIIPNNKADISTLKVRVYSSISDTTGIDDAWSLGTDYLTLTSTSKVYFLQEKEAGIYEVYFGDGILGQQPESGNVVSIEYVETNGEVGNGVVAFTKSSDASISSVEFVADTVTGSTASQTSGGADLEGIAKIKFLAPKFYQTSNRAVTENDYSALVYKIFPNAQSVHVYGGETVTPPQYGTVYVAIKPKSGEKLTLGEKVTLEAQLRKDYSLLTVFPVIVDADFVDLVFDLRVVYSPTTMSISPGVLRSLVYAYVYSYSAAVVERFGSDFYYSKMAEGINNLDRSVLGVYTKIKMRKSIDSSTILTAKSYTFKFGNAFFHPYDGYTSVISTNQFSHPDLIGVVYPDCSLRDDGNGVVNVVRPDPQVDGDYLTVYPSVGTVDYTAGTVVVNSKFTPTSSSTAFPIILTVEPQSTNIFITDNAVLRINSTYLDSVQVTVTTEDESSVTSLIR